MAALLFEPYSIKNVTLPNRIVMSPMCMYSCSAEDGVATGWHVTHYHSRAVGQTGLIMLEASAVTEQGRISKNDLGIWNDSHITGLKRISDAIHSAGSKSAIQIAHAGRKAMIDGPIIAPSPIAFDEQMKKPEEMTIEQINETISAFQAGARRAKEAGFDVIEIHGAHGYLINEFLSPLTNRRSDSYGGSQQKRYRFLQEIIAAVRQVWNGPLFVRISAHDYHPDGNSVEDYTTFAKWMKEDGVDLIDCSSGAVVPAKIPVFPGYQVKFSEKIRSEADIPTGAVGLITTGIQAEEIIQNGRADLVFIGRELLRNPYWPREAAKELRTEIAAPKQYERGW
ncbi:NADPH dehydrogenase NamA [Fictibacillus aquaticus]|uniref:NADPH dehydrogenase n=1 Tax=Fictibacillus aquaticus TaxID=2021314 RepID=A0A235FAZ9_9BACL|nr:NADPH dehydrogenase NamA [Fictibacillus aquaticus]OYD58359.1 NADPH dehydrogenase NamA [Fictibacillus aquaticus]